jgi:hypothetical protein
MLTLANDCRAPHRTRRALSQRAAEGGASAASVRLSFIVEAVA